MPVSICTPRSRAARSIRATTSLQPPIGKRAFDGWSPNACRQRSQTNAADSRPGSWWKQKTPAEELSWSAARAPTRSVAQSRKESGRQAPA